MREIKFRAWNAANGTMERDMFYINQFDGKCYYPDPTHFDHDEKVNFYDCGEEEPILMQFTGLKDKNGKEIYEGDVVSFKNPVRTTQTHTGDNIPNGSYTEPLEPGIVTHEGEVVFADGAFQFKDYNSEYLSPLADLHTEWDLESIREAISYGRPDRFVWDDPEEGDLQYLMSDCAKVKTPEELVSYLSGIEVIKNIYETPELIKTCI